MELYLAEHPVRLAAEVRRHSGQGFFFPEVMSQGIVEPPDELRASRQCCSKDDNHLCRGSRDRGNPLADAFEAHTPCSGWSIDLFQEYLSVALEFLELQPEVRKQIVPFLAEVDALQARPSSRDKQEELVQKRRSLQKELRLLATMARDTPALAEREKAIKAKIDELNKKLVGA